MSLSDQDGGVVMLYYYILELVWAGFSAGAIVSIVFQLIELLDYWADARPHEARARYKVTELGTTSLTERGIKTLSLRAACSCVPWLKRVISPGVQ